MPAQTLKSTVRQVVMKFRKTELFAAVRQVVMKLRRTEHFELCAREFPRACRLCQNAHYASLKLSPRY